MFQQILIWVGDALLTILCLVVLFIIVSGGGSFVLAGQDISMRSVGNPLAASAILAVIRYRFRGTGPFLGLKALDLSRMDERAAAALVSLGRRLQGLDGTQAPRLVAAVAIAALILKSVLAITNAGFFSGDDVEIHEMTMGHLLGFDWPAWSVRSAFFPMVFIYPAQALLAAAGVVEMHAFVSAGRVGVAALSTLALPILFSIVKREQGVPVAILAVFLLATSRLHIAFGSAELPRPVATVFVLGAFLCLIERGFGRAAFSGLLLAIGGALRFSEIVFLAPVAVQFVWERRVRDLLTFLVAFCAALATIQGGSDYLYWGAPFYSAHQIVDFTLVQGLSSRGYDPVWYYLSNLSSWTNVAVIGFAIFGARKRQWRPVVWLVLPIVILSALPHKESRYLIPVMPFLAWLAASGVWRAIEAIRDGGTSGARDGWTGWLPFAIVLGLAVSVLFEAGGFRLRRSNDAIRLARTLAAMPGRDPLAVEQLWRMGGRLYLGRQIKDLRDLDPDHLRAPDGLKSTASDSRLRSIALTNETCRFTDCGAVLAAAGFDERPSDRRSEYRLWVRQ